MLEVDLFLFKAINQFVGKFWWLDIVAVFFAQYFEFFLIYFFLLFLTRDFKRYWQMVAQGLFAAFLARLGLVELIRWLWPRTRPFVEHHINLLFNYNPTEASFPSGHAAFYFAIATVVYSYNKKAGILFFIASFLISFARVFSGIHWPSDIISGAIVGIISGRLIILFSQKFFPDTLR
jgi:undecaprenyl-diphosphatase